MCVSMQEKENSNIKPLYPFMKKARGLNLAQIEEWSPLCSTWLNSGSSCILTISSRLDSFLQLDTDMNGQESEADATQIILT